MTTVHWILISVTAFLAFVALIFKFGSWYGEVNSDRKMFEEFMQEIRKNIDDIRKNINDVLGRLSPPPTISESLICLSELGEQISKNIGAKAWAAEVAQELVGQAKDMDPFQVQMLSFEHAKSFEPDDELLAKIRQSAYEAGIDLEGVGRVLGVELRDNLLQLNNLS